MERKREKKIETEGDSDKYQNGKEIKLKSEEWQVKKRGRNLKMILGM